ncbi:MAG: hypothetical protein V1800_14255 [Candidatus Latescibacterota bacterium]
MMQTYRVETMIQSDSRSTIKDLPFYAGGTLEINVRGHKYERECTPHYPFCGKSVRFVGLFGNVVEDDWSLLQ